MSNYADYRLECYDIHSFEDEHGFFAVKSHDNDKRLHIEDMWVKPEFRDKKIGQQYYKRQNELRSVLYDNEGAPYQYRDISNLDDASQEDIDYNIDLANKKAALGEFFRAEIKNENGDPVDGEYHGLTQEFKDARSKFEYWVPGSESSPFGNWYRKPGISDAAYASYEAKYYDQHAYTKAIRVNGIPTGAIVKDQTYRAPKVEFRFVREVTRSGESMTSKKYDKIMNPIKMTKPK